MCYSYEAVVINFSWDPLPNNVDLGASRLRYGISRSSRYCLCI